MLRQVFGRFNVNLQNVVSLANEMNERLLLKLPPVRLGNMALTFIQSISMNSKHIRIARVDSLPTWKEMIQRFFEVAIAYRRTAFIKKMQNKLLKEG